MEENYNSASIYMLVMIELLEHTINILIKEKCVGEVKAISIFLNSSSKMNKVSHFFQKNLLILILHRIFRF